MHADFELFKPTSVWAHPIFSIAAAQLAGKQRHDKDLEDETLEATHRDAPGKPRNSVVPGSLGEATLLASLRGSKHPDLDLANRNHVRWYRICDDGPFLQWLSVRCTETMPHSPNFSWGLTKNAFSGHPHDVEKSRADSLYLNNSMSSSTLVVFLLVIQAGSIFGRY